MEFLGFHQMESPFHWIFHSIPFIVFFWCKQSSHFAVCGYSLATLVSNWKFFLKPHRVAGCFLI